MPHALLFRAVLLTAAKAQIAHHFTTARPALNDNVDPPDAA
ncbi:hypothetical protein [Novosphingobium sp. MBES04]|nr:hypothetical protein [Novosphingobium sp. MBES04]